MVNGCASCIIHSNLRRCSIMIVATRKIRSNPLLDHRWITHKGKWSDINNSDILLLNFTDGASSTAKTTHKKEQQTDIMVLHDKFYAIYMSLSLRGKRRNCFTTLTTRKEYRLFIAYPHCTYTHTKISDDYGLYLKHSFSEVDMPLEELRITRLTCNAKDSINGTNSPKYPLYGIFSTNQKDSICILAYE